MSTQKHTPGPWAAYFDETHGVTGPDKGRVAICMNLKGAYGLAGRRTAEEVAANARLIAAAPELLEEAQFSIMFLELSLKAHDYLTTLEYERLARLRALVSKAEGAQ